ncbi:MAG: hypothetical protein IT323_13625 [Anaerolineae bacterium]|nr:hypothetical protein [Anaerolineae bacterium]
MSKRTRTIIVDQNSGQEIVRQETPLTVTFLLVVVLLLGGGAVAALMSGDVLVAVVIGAFLLFMLVLRLVIALQGRTPYMTKDRYEFWKPIWIFTLLGIVGLTVEYFVGWGHGPVTWFLSLLK